MKVRTALVSVSLGAGALALSLTAALPSASAASSSDSTASGTAHFTGNFRLEPKVHVPSTHLPHPAAVSNGPDNAKIYKSTNWSGYADVAAKNVKLTNVSAEFTVAGVNCAASGTGTYGSWTAEWVGLDGFSSASVEQDGVSAYCATTTSTPVYYVWYETYPDATVTVGNVNAGDAINVAVGRYKTTNSYLITITDITSQSSYSNTVACPSGSTCPDTSAEVIMEAPYEAGILPLADYGMATFGSSQVSANYAPKGAFGGTSTKFSLAELNMVSGTTGDPESTTGGLFGGKDFSTTWVSSGP